MALPVPNLDDRRFQDLVDDAKRLVQQRCPEWTDHNVSDPGVTLIEAFAWMTDQLLYRLNRVPDRHYVKFLELIGVRLFPPAAARGDVTFWLSAAQPDTVRIAGGTQVATIRTETDDAVVFTTLDDLPIVPGHARPRAHLHRRQEARRPDHRGRRTAATSPPSTRRRSPANVLLVGLSEPAPSNAVRLDFRCTHRGRRRRPDLAAPRLGGLDGRRLDALRARARHDGRPQPRRRGDRPRPARATPSRWSRSCARRGSGPASRTPEEGQPFYSASPSVRGVAAATVGGTTDAVHADVVVDEIVGHVRGRGRPALPPAATAGRARRSADGRSGLRRRGGLAGVDAGARLLGVGTGGPALRARRRRRRDLVRPGRPRAGRIGARATGPCRAKGRRIKVDVYLTGGGRLGNIAPRSISVLKSSIPYVSRVENRRPDGRRRRRRGHRERQGPRSRSRCAPAAAP